MYLCHPNIFITVICTIKAIPMRICHAINQLAIYPCAKTWKCHRLALYQMVMPPWRFYLFEFLVQVYIHTSFSFYGWLFQNPKISDTYTVTQAVNALGFGWFQVKLSLCVGLCWMADSMEMTILSVLGPALHCDWGISRYQQALTTTIVFLGMMMSSTFWGQLSDRCGRKPVPNQSFHSIHIKKSIRIDGHGSLSNFCSLLSVAGAHALWSIAVFIRIFKFAGTKFCMATIASWSCGLCYWMCTPECDFIC